MVGAEADGFPESLSRYVLRGSVPLPSFPTEFPPGSDEKIAVMRDRVSRGEYLHHPGDVFVVVFRPYPVKLAGRPKDVRKRYVRGVGQVRADGSVYRPVKGRWSW